LVTLNPKVVKLTFDFESLKLTLLDIERYGMMKIFDITNSEGIRFGFFIFNSVEQAPAQLAMAQHA
jgi:hypothetical protein